MDWRLVPVEPGDVMRWSFGRVETASELYSQGTFGPSKDWTCECGKYCGGHEDGIICDECGVKVSSNSALLRRTRLGHVELCVPCRHPLGMSDEYLHLLPIAPIAIRLQGYLTPNSLGKKYEELIHMNSTTRAKLPKKDTAEFWLAARNVDGRPLQTVVESIIGTPSTSPSQDNAAVEEGSALFGVLLQAISRLDDSICSIVRSMGCALEVRGRM